MDLAIGTLALGVTMWLGRGWIARNHRNRLSEEEARLLYGIMGGFLAALGVVFAWLAR